MKSSDKEHLQWMYSRMRLVHGEKKNLDYMKRFKEIIDNLKEKKL